MHLVNHNGSDLRGSLNSHSSLGRAPGCINFLTEHMDAAQLKNESLDPGNSDCCCCSVPQSYLPLCDLMDCSMPGFSVLHYLPKFAQTHAHWIGNASNYLILSRLLLLPSVFPSIRVFSNESALHMRGSKDWSFSFNISPSNEHPGLISFRMD